MCGQKNFCKQLTPIAHAIFWAVFFLTILKFFVFFVVNYFYTRSFWYKNDSFAWDLGLKSKIDSSLIFLVKYYTSHVALNKYNYTWSQIVRLDSIDAKTSNSGIDLLGGHGIVVSECCSESLSNKSKKWVNRLSTTLPLIFPYFGCDDFFEFNYMKSCIENYKNYYCDRNFVDEKVFEKAGLLRIASNVCLNNR